MLDLLLQYGLFLAKTVTVVMAVVVIIIAISNVGSRRRLMQEEGDLEVLALNDRYDDYADAMREAVFDKDELKAWQKAEKKKEKQKAKQKSEPRPRVFVLGFHGDIRASAVEFLRREITAVLTLADPARAETRAWRGRRCRWLH